MSPRPVTITSYNMHKGISTLNRKVQVNRMADALGALSSDILFLQEVQGQHLNRSRRTDFPDAPHYDIIGDSFDYHRSYGKNAVYPRRYHGNVILSRLPLKVENNLNISVSRLGQRGLLRYEVVPEGQENSLVCLCVHLNLREPGRLKQCRAISDYVSRHIDPDSPLIITGDFNDWRRKSAHELGRALDLNEVFVDNTDKRPKAFPSRLPILSLDRIYTRNLDVTDSEIHNSKDWQHLSDHLPLSITVRPHRKMDMKSDREI